MKKSLLRLSSLVLLSLAFLFVLSSFGPAPLRLSNMVSKLKFPYKKAGLTDKEAAAHLLNRFSFGPKPGEVERVVEMGLENWFAQQLEGNLADDSLNKMLADYETLGMSNTDLALHYLNNQQMKHYSIKEKWVSKDSLYDTIPKKHNAILDSLRKEHGIKQQSEVVRQLINQKILRAAYSENQLLEVMASFWSNHFNIYIYKNDASPNYLTSFERDVIRKHELGHFGDLLLATAKSPAMLTYLDNFVSVANENDALPILKKTGDTMAYNKEMTRRTKNKKGNQGLNENYAREIMELHSLGVDGGYTQADVTNAAKVFTGWTIFPQAPYMGYYDQVMHQIKKQGEEKLAEEGFVHDGDFMFAMNKHDKTEKTVLGHVFPANGGVEEGTTLVDVLAKHPSTARFISRKLAVKFVSDNPSKELIDNMAKIFLKTNGDIKETLLEMVKSKEFWAKESVRSKIKSPFELAISSVRALGGKIDQPYQFFNWISKMGERMYHYQAPTGFPDKGTYWVNTGSLLNRMNFGLGLATQRIAGFSFDPSKLTKGTEPESANDALKTYCSILLQGRDVDATVARLTPVITDPQLIAKVNQATKALKTTETTETPMLPQDNMMGGEGGNMIMMGDSDGSENKKARKEKIGGKRKAQDYTVQQLESSPGNNTLLAQVTGVIIGSPEFQRR